MSGRISKEGTKHTPISAIANAEFIAHEKNRTPVEIIKSMALFRRNSMDWYFPKGINIRQ